MSKTYMIYTLNFLHAYKLPATVGLLISYIHPLYWFSITLQPFIFLLQEIGYFLFLLQDNYLD